MDCRDFRKQHFAYLDDTLPGDVMSLAQCHLMKCDSCGAHDTMVRRSLMLVRNVKILEPSADFRRKMQARLDEARCEKQQEQLRLVERASSSPARVSSLQPVILSVFAASVLVVGTIVWRDRTPAPEQTISMQAAPSVPTFQPVIDNPLDSVMQPAITVTPAMMHAMATGNPMWPATYMVDEAPTQFMNADFTQVKATH
ncbi:MAG: hypothetical protein ABJC26_10970 [Gemmatimonadaceae bacterium]